MEGLSFILFFAFVFSVLAFNALKNISPKILAERHVKPSGAQSISRILSYRIGQKALSEIVEAELSAFVDHPQISSLSEFSGDGGSSINATFSMNFRKDSQAVEGLNRAYLDFSDEEQPDLPHRKQLIVSVLFDAKRGGLTELLLSIGTTSGTEYENSIRDSAMNYLIGAITTRVELINVLYNVVLNSLAPIESVLSLAAGVYHSLPDSGPVLSGLAAPHIGPGSFAGPTSFNEPGSFSGPTSFNGPGSFNGPASFTGPESVAGPESFAGPESSPELSSYVLPVLSSQSGSSAQPGSSAQSGSSAQPGSPAGAPGVVQTSSTSVQQGSDGARASADERKCAGCGKMTSSLFSFCMYCGAQL